MVKGTIKFNTKGSKVTSKKWKTLLSNVSHCYISGEEYGMQDITYYALKKNGKLYAWGYNKHGEVGNGKTKKVKKPTLILKNVKYFTCSYQISGTAAQGGCTAYAIKKNGDLMSWGVNDFLTVQSGLGEKVKKPTKILEDVDWVDGADHVAIAITKDKVLWTWGTAIGVTSVEGNTVMHEGIGLTSVAKNVIAADIDQFTLYFIDTSNRLKYVGFAPTSAYENTTTPKKMLSKVKAIYTTDVDGSFALKTDGSLYGWGFAKGGKYITKPKKLATGFAK